MYLNTNYVHQCNMFSSLTNDFHFNIIISNNYKNVSRIITVWDAINSKFCFIKTVNTMEFEELKTYFLTIVVEVKLIGIAKLQYIGVFCTWVNIKYLPTYHVMTENNDFIVYCTTLSKPHQQLNDYNNYKQFHYY